MLSKIKANKNKENKPNTEDSNINKEPKIYHGKLIDYMIEVSQNVSSSLKVINALHDNNIHGMLTLEKEVILLTSNLESFNDNDFFWSDDGQKCLEHNHELVKRFNELTEKHQSFSQIFNSSCSILMSIGSQEGSSDKEKQMRILYITLNSPDNVKQLDILTYPLGELDMNEEELKEHAKKLIADKADYIVQFSENNIISAYMLKQASGIF